MLVLTRGEGQTIAIGDDITVEVIQFRGANVRLGVTAPREVSVLRGELKGTSVRGEDQFSWPMLDRAARRKGLPENLRLEFATEAEGMLDNLLEKYVQRYDNLKLAT